MFSIYAGSDAPAAVIGDMYIDSASDQVFVCTDTTEGAAVWSVLAGGGLPQPEPQLGAQRCDYCDSLAVSGSLRCESCGATDAGTQLTERRLTLSDGSEQDV
jgi:hypothetical protein